MKYRWGRRGIVALAIVLCSTSARAEAPFNFETNPGNLPKTIVPTHYRVRIEPDLPARTIQGEVRIDIEVRATVDAIVLNANELTIDRATLLPAGDSPHDDPVALTATLDADLQQLSLAGPEPLAPGAYVIEITYRGIIHPNAEGFFFDRYPTASGEKEMFGTQMEVLEARRALPCWDEPAFRATFDVTLVVPASFTAFSNMPATGETPLPGDRKAVSFARTPSMSSYLLAFFGGELETIEADHHGTRLIIAFTEGKTATAGYALESTKRILDYYADYFGAPYPLPQLVQIGVPNAFSNFGAMENWGCISYIDTLLLYDPAVMSQTDKEWVFKVIAHEIAHQWFGNLVTMGWWDNLWLNEGFASWLETKCTNDLNPTWNTWLRANSDKERALALDARQSTHAIQLPGVTETSAMDAFDTISYEKGKAFVRMLEAFLGETPFRDGIRLYMQRHALSNTTTADLWAALAESSGQPVTAIAAGWTEQPGFPIVSATVSDDRLHLDQQRFILDDPQAENLSWSIPVTFAPYDQLTSPSSHLLAATPADLPWPGDRSAPKLNVGDTGFYRVLYDEATLSALIAALPTLPVADQLNLLGDTWALVLAGRVAATDYLDIVLALRHSTAQPVWETMLRSLGTIDSWQQRQPGRFAYQSWLVELLTPQLDHIGWDATPGESPLLGTLRARLINILAKSGDEATIAECQRRFARYQEDPTSLSGDLRPAVFNTVGRYADEAMYRRLHDLARAAPTTAEKRRAYGAMQHALEPALARRTLELTLGDELSTSERNANVQRVGVYGEHLDLAWEFAVAHAAELLAAQPAFGVNSYLPEIVQNATDSRYAHELEQVTREHLGEAGEAEAAKATSLIRLNAAVSERELPRIDAWVARRVTPRS
ncbi:M1 family metallopeptidase [Synoicihabitans lomoniglobus]|uniref:Aminopeptidase n=1 Tax=Synoicihabitans lomoniglobus TaxID=2909285 RepID=A0AAE9ZVJ2_9BACT|nr:M1 family metallopeptidase [Opitutaceae bacterium LMO-M01]WED64166.1 M1 family metallopeptidase [Opitutaceae bacterium LMO-M01]